MLLFHLLKFLLLKPWLDGGLRSAWLDGGARIPKPAVPNPAVPLRIPCELLPWDEPTRRPPTFRPELDGGCLPWLDGGPLKEKRSDC